MRVLYYCTQIPSTNWQQSKSNISTGMNLMLPWKHSGYNQALVDLLQVSNKLTFETMNIEIAIVINGKFLY